MNDEPMNRDGHAEEQPKRCVNNRKKIVQGQQSDA